MFSLYHRALGLSMNHGNLLNQTHAHHASAGAAVAGVIAALGLVIDVVAVSITEIICQN